MHPRVLDANAWELISDLVAADITKNWTLCGGTGLALQFGHRTSFDLDFFRYESFEPEQLLGRMAGIGQVEILTRAERTLHAHIRGMRISFLGLESPLLFESIAYRGLQLGDPRDIATLKFVAIGGRGSRKDFVDLYFYLRQSPGLEHLFELLEQRDSRIDWNRYHLMKSLTYFADAEEEPMPNMLKPVEWEEIREFFNKVATEAF